MSNSRKNRFGFDPISDMPVGPSPRRRWSGPAPTPARDTATARRDAADPAADTADARAYREAAAEGLLLSRVPLAAIGTDDLPRDRLDLTAVANADAMDELKASIRAYGQKEPIELYRTRAGALQLKKGWRRLTALRALFDETGEDAFATALARVDPGVTDRLRHYVDMVEENTVREDLTFADMAQLAIQAAADPAIDGADPEDLVAPLYGSLHKMKRSYIRSFVRVLVLLGDDLRYPKAVPRDVGVSLDRLLRSAPDLAVPLRADLAQCTDEAGQGKVLRAALERGRMPEQKPKAAGRQGYAFHVGAAKVTVRRGELRIREQVDFTNVAQPRLEAAVAALQAALKGA